MSLIKTDLLRSAVAVMHTQVGEVEVKTEGGWHVVAMSPDHTTLVRVDISEKCFENYDGTADFCVSLDKLGKALASAADFVEINVENGMLIVKSGRYKHKIPVLNDVAGKNAKIPVIEGRAECTVNADDFKSIAGKTVFDVDTYEFSCEGGFLNVKTDNGSGAGTEISIPAEVTGAGRSVFAVAPIDAFVKAMPKGAKVKIMLGEDKPMTVFFGADSYEVEYMIAPIIDNE